MPENPRIEELRRRVQKDPASIAFAQLAEEHRRVGEYAEAVRVCRAGLSQHPTYLSARVTLGRALIELGDLDEAETELQYVLRSAPENLAAVRGLGEIYQRRGNLPEALRQYQIALALAKHDPELEESVHDLTRQLRAADQDRHESPMRAIEGRAATPPAHPSGDRATIPLGALSPELEAAADEFTKALQALDALTLDLPAPDLPEEDAVSEPGEDEGEAPPSRASAAAHVDPPAAPASGDQAVVNELESWLEAIVRDRQERTAQ